MLVKYNLVWKWICHGKNEMIPFGGSTDKYKEQKCNFWFTIRLLIVN
jgi:hypothetical protein